MYIQSSHVGHGKNFYGSVNGGTITIAHINKKDKTVIEVQRGDVVHKTEIDGDTKCVWDYGKTYKKFKRGKLVEEQRLSEYGNILKNNETTDHVQREKLLGRYGQATYKFVGGNVRGVKFYYNNEFFHLRGKLLNHFEG